MADISIEKKYLDKENEIMDAVAKEFDVKHIINTPTTHRVDGLFMCDDKEEIEYFIEAKSRNIKSVQYDTTKLELGKWMALGEFNKIRPTILAIGWTDKTGYSLIKDLEPSRFTMMNRKRVRRPSDWQIAVEIPVKQFTFI